MLLKSNGKSELHFILVNVLAILHIQAQRLCPTGWLVNQDYNTCYKVGVNNLAKTWDEARASCQLYQADLVNIDDAGEKAILERLVKNSVTQSFWIGGNKRPADGLWIWSQTGNKIQLSQITWDFGRPDSVSGNCLLMRNNGTYTNDDCYVLRPYFCERSMGISTYCDVDGGWEPVGGTCIKISPQKTSWPSARADCNNNGGDLVVVSSLEILYYLKDYNKFNNLKFWIGISDFASDGNLHWVDEVIRNKKSQSRDYFNFWGQQQPMLIFDGSGLGNCTSVNQGFMTINRCDEQNAYACQKIPNECPEGWIPFKNTCYLINSAREKFTTWYDANTTCTKYGANLLTINNIPEQQFIERELKDSFSYTDFWLGFTSTTNNSYIWVTGGTVTGFVNWVNDQYPVSDQTRDNCGAIGVTNGKWYVSSNCFQKLAYVCQIDAGKQIIPNPSNINTYGGNSNGAPCVFPFKYLNKIYYQCTIVDRDNSWCSTTYDYDMDGKFGYCSTVKVCEVGWSENDIYCYKFIQNPTALNWIEAQNRCSQESGFLAYILDNKAQTVVNKLLTNDDAASPAWIGLKYSSTNQWLWGDADSFKGFKNWRNSHPNSSSVGDCGAIDLSDLYLGEWMSFNCENKFNNMVCAKYSTNGPINPTVTYAPSTTESIKCGRGWMERPFTNLCYHFSTKYQTYFTANLDCQSLGGNMVSITTVEEQIFVQNTIKTLNQPTFWIGAISNNNKGWSWVDSSPFVFTNWAQSQYNTGANQFCAVVSNQFDGQWKTVECTNLLSDIRFNYICKKNSIGVVPTQMSTAFPTQAGSNYGCLNGWSYFKTNQCYKYYAALSDHKSYDDAKEKCKQENSYLVEVFSESENQFLVALIQAKKLERKGKAFGCPTGWTTNSNNNMCYMYTSNSTNDWNKAKSYCSSMGGSLAIIKNSNENDFVNGLSVGNSVWIGLKRDAGSNEWKWSDGTLGNIQYSNWQSNNPTIITNIDRCGVLRSSFNGKWYDMSCVGTDMYNIICQKEATVQDLMGMYGTNRHANGSQIENRSKSANATCTQYFSDQTQGGGNCIHKNQCPNAFYITGLCGEYNDPDVECCLDTSRLEETAWIGMYDELSGFSQVSFKWNSGTIPTYSNWAINEPGPNAAKCVSMHIKDFGSGAFVAGQWKSTECNYKNGFFCKKPVEIIPVTAIVDEPGCPPGFKTYEKKCFKNVANLLTWQEAESNCNSISNATLIAILDRFQQYWLTNQFQTGTGVTWIGLSDQVTQGTYVWSSKDKFTYSNWDREKPDQSPGRCVGQNAQGFWSNYDCAQRYASICMVENSLFTTTQGPPTTTTPPLKCASGWTEAEGRCHKLFAPSVAARLNWFDAEAYCKSLNGHLSTYKSYTQIFGVMQGQNIYQYGDVQFWIGLNTLDPSGGYKWVDGSPVGYYYWDIGQPNSHNGVEDCISMKNTGRWKNEFCYGVKGWSCEIERGLNPNKTQDVIAPESFNFVECPNNGQYNFTIFRDKCYYASTGVGEEKLNWVEARDFCRNAGGDLLSIHTQYDLQYVATLAGKRGYNSWWIGLEQFSTFTSGFVWSDGSPLNFINWNPGEPNDAHGGEKCVEMYTNSFWNDANCGVKMGFVCEKSNRTQVLQPEIVLPLSFSNGNVEPCENGYSTFGIVTTDNTGVTSPCVFPFKYKNNLYYECITSERVNPWCATTYDYDVDQKWGYCSNIKCFKLIDQKNTFGNARKVCQNDGGGSLASIHNELEYSYVSALMRKKKSDFFIGLWAPTGNTFYYEDNSILDFAKWAPNKPGSIIVGNERCVVMSVDKATPALWKNVDCTIAQSHVCSKYANGVRFASGCEERTWLGENSNENITLTCPQNLTIAIVKADFGRDAYSFTCDDKYHYGDDCSSRESTTDKVRELCLGKKNCYLTANVETFSDPCPYVIKQLRVWYQCVAMPVKTTNGNANGANCVFPFKYNGVNHYQCTYENHPGFDFKKWCCTEPDCDKPGSKWGDCPETNAPLNSNNCSKPDYTSFDSGKNCYKLISDKKLSWIDAQNFCENSGGKLVTISDVYEQGYIRLLSYSTGGISYDPWIGLKKNNSIQYFWSDDWPIEYTNWAQGSSNEDTLSCAFVLSDNGKWNATSCDTLKSFICKITQETRPLVTIPPPGYCPTGYVEFGAFCYKYEIGIKTYPEAKFDCIQKGGSLTSIINEDELDYIRGLTNNPIWIGLEKNVNTGIYEWVDGSPLGFTSYSPLFNGIQTCVYQSNGLWLDSSCSNFYRAYVCKTQRRLNSTTTITTPETSPITMSTRPTTQTFITTTLTNPTSIPLTSSSSSSISISSSDTTQPETTTIVTTAVRTTVVDQTKAPNGGLEGGAIFALVAAIIVIIIIVVLMTLMLLKKRKIVNVKLPLLDPIFFKPDSYSNITLTYKKGQTNGIENPNLDSENPNLHS